MALWYSTIPLETVGICAGDEVRVVESSTYTYYKYSEWSKLGAAKQHFVPYGMPSEHKIYKVLLVDKHDFDERRLVLIQDQDTTQVFIVDSDGIKIIKN